MKSATGIRYSDSDSMFCQNPKCAQGDAVTAVKVCHNCSSRPLLLCAVCDKKAHAELRSKGHMRFDLSTSARPLSAMAQGTTAATVVAATSGQALLPATGGSGSSSSSTIVPIHTRSLSLPDRRTSSSVLSSFDPQPSTSNQAAASHFKFASGDEESEDGADENLDNGEAFDEPDGKYLRVPGGKWHYQLEHNDKSSPLVGEAKYRPLQLSEGQTSWVLATAETLEQLPKGSFFTVYLHWTPDGEPEIVEIPTQRGVKIREVLDQLLASHSLSTSQVEIYFGNALPLTEYADTGLLGTLLLRVVPHGSAFAELSRRLSNGSFQSSGPFQVSPSDRGTAPRAEDVRSSSLDTSAFRKSSSTNMLKPSSASASGSSSSLSMALHGRSSLVGSKRNARDSKQQPDLSRVMHLSEHYAGASGGRHQASGGGASGDDAGSEMPNSLGAVSSVSRPVRKAASTAAGFFPTGSSALGSAATASVYDDQHQDVSPSGTISKAWRGTSAAVAQAASGRLNSLLPLAYKERDNKIERLQGKLDDWSRNGIPPMPELYSMSRLKYEASILEMEGHWTNFIPAAALTSKQKDQQEATWELFYTEVEFIKSIDHVVVELFMSCLFNLQTEQLLNEIDSEKLFANVCEVGDMNINLWQTEMIRVLEHSRRTHELLNPSLLKPAFSRFSERFQSYTKYCLEQPACSEYLKKMEKENEAFRIFLAWAEAQKQCNRLKLHDLLVKPMQRITRYSLLLNAILKKTDDPETRRDLVEMIGNVDTFVRHIDQTLRHKHEAQRLKEMAARIESYDVVDMPYSDAEANKMLATYSSFDLQQPMPGCGNQLRHLMYEGALKMKEANIKSDVICFLFTDMFLITKAKRADKVKITKAPIRIDRCIVEEFGKDSNAYFLIIQLTEYGVAQAAFAFHGENIAKWVKMIRKAQGLYKSAQMNALQTPTLSAPLGAPVLNGDGEDEMGFVGPDLMLASGEESGADDSGAGSNGMVRSPSMVAPVAMAQPPNAATDASEFGYGAATGGTADGAAPAAEGTWAGGEDEEETGMAMRDTNYYGTRALGAAMAVAAGAAAAVTRSASSPVMSTRPKANTLQQDGSAMNWPDDKASSRRGARFRTADSIPPYPGASAVTGRDQHSGFPANADNRSQINGDEQWELVAGSSLFAPAQSPAANVANHAELAVDVLGSQEGRVRADSGAAARGTVPPRALPRKHVPAATSDHSTNGSMEELSPEGRGSGMAVSAAAAAPGMCSKSDQDQGAVASASSPAATSHPSAVPRSSRKLSQAELMRMRAQMFVMSPQDGAEV